MIASFGVVDPSDETCINNFSCSSVEEAIGWTSQETFVIGLKIESIEIVPTVSSGLLFNSDER